MAGARSPDKPSTQVSAGDECSRSAQKLDPDTTRAQDQSSQNSQNLEDNTTGEPPKVTLADLDSTPVSLRKYPDHVDHSFHVFVWLNMSENNNATENKVKKNAVGTDRTDASSLPRTVEQSLKEDLGEIDQFLNRRTSLTDRLSYRACPHVNRQEVYEMLAKDRGNITGATGKDQKVRQIYETKWRL